MLRYRPTVQTKFGPKPEVLEYVPNDKYSWSFVKSTMRSYCEDKVGDSRVWNDQYVRHDVISPRVLYSIHDYCPGMPIDLERECEAMNLHPFIWNELAYLPQEPKDKHPPIDPDGTINKMVQRMILKDGEIPIVEKYLNELKPIRNGYEMMVENLPFEIGRYIISLHVQRLHLIGKALNLYLEKVIKQLAEQAAALAQSGGQDGAPTGIPKNSFVSTMVATAATNKFL